MNDENTAGLTPHREVDISARFIRQAYEHLQHTQGRYVTFLFTGELVADATCIGITTGRPLLIEQNPQTRSVNENSDWTIDTLSEQVILDVIRATHPIDTRRIGDALGIAGNDTPLRQRIRRILMALTTKRVIRRGGNKSYPSFSPMRASVEQPAEPERMKVRPASARKIERKDITDETVINILLRFGPINSRGIGDHIGIPRPDNIVRSKITEIIGRLRRGNQVRQLGVQNGGHLYEWQTPEVREQS